MTQHTKQVIALRKRKNTARKVMPFIQKAALCLSYGAAVGTIFFIAAH